MLRICRLLTCLFIMCFASVVSTAYASDLNASTSSDASSASGSTINQTINQTTNPAELSKLETLATQLTKNSLRKLPELVNQIADVQAPQVEVLLTNLLAGDLYFNRASKKIIRVNKNPEGLYDNWDILTGEQNAALGKSAIKKIRTNNAIRSKIKGMIALLDLSHPSIDIRLAAVKQILDKPDQNAIAHIKKRLATETQPEVLSAMQVAVAVANLTSGDITTKSNAIAILAESLEPAAKNALTKALENLSAEEQQLKTSIEKALSGIEQQRSVYSFVENLFFGLSLGSVLLLAAIGLAITFGVMGVINMAHGEMMMLGAYTTYVIQQMFPQLINYSLLMAIPAAFIVSGLVGILIERGVIRHLKGRPLETLLATFGISLILQQLVRTIFSPLNRQVQAPDWMSGSWQVNPIFSLTYNRLYIVIFSLVVFFALMLILKKTSLGLHVRAVSQNREMARALSIKSDWVDAITFGLGSGIAGIAGVVLSQLTNVGPNLGQAYIIDSFLVVVFGGVGNLWGTLVAAMSLGSMNKFLEPITGSVLANIIVLVGLVLFIQKRPKGLFPQKGRSAD